MPGIVWLKIAAVYFVLGTGLGIYMGASGDHVLFPVHAHLNLLGWASLALIGLIYQQFPALAGTRLARIQFWVHNLALPPAMLVLACYLRGNQGLEPILAITSVAIGVAVLLFAVNLFRNLK
jgi:cbb3-type cytochrome oxidase subunit 1